MTAATISSPRGRLARAPRPAALALCCVYVFVTSCGQKGPLVLPSPPPGAAGSTALPGDSRDIAEDGEDTEDAEEGARGDADGE